VHQRLGESLRSFIQWFSQFRNIIPRISNASVVVTFCQGVRDEKMLKKLTTYDIQYVVELFSLAEKCLAYSGSGEGCQAQSEHYYPRWWQQEQKEEG
jgi:alpha-D-ribose 1-methylphosphonate 5-triphosphate synthase subunit PhnL